MKVFISWSGERSRLVAEALRGWLPTVLQAVRPWLSSYDLEAGARWHSEMALQLEQARFGIICLTPENLDAPWMLFEAGALSRNLDGSRICPYLFGFGPAELRGPLLQFQATRADRDDTFRLVSAMNRDLGDGSVSTEVLRQAFDMWWPVLADKLARVAPNAPALHGAPDPKTTSERDQLEELVRNVRAHSRAAPSEEENSGGPDRRQFVFIVHGHDQGRKEELARFIEKLGAHAVILHEQANSGLTVIEKLEAYSDVGYAIVLMTGDDFGGVASEKRRHRPRARQNVILELGYFIAKLGRNRVCVLHEKDVEVPSDYAGVLYLPIETSGRWKFDLARELKAAGFTIDLNRAF